MVTGPESGDGMNEPADNDASEFEQLAGEQQPGLLQEFWMFMREEKKWWLIPLVVVLLLLASLIVFTGGSVLAPLMYPFM